MKDLNQRPAAEVAGAATVAEMAQREGYADPVEYAAALHRTVVGWGLDAGALDGQRQRLETLVNIADRGKLAEVTAQELAAHYAILNALMLRFAQHAAKKDPMTERVPDVALKWADAALRCQKAAQRVLGALHVVADDAMIKRVPRVERE